MAFVRFLARSAARGTLSVSGGSCRNLGGGSDNGGEQQELWSEASGEDSSLAASYLRGLGQEPYLPLPPFLL